MIPVLPYNLPDEALLKNNQIPDCLVWQPDDVYLVLGRSNDAIKSLYTERVEEDGITVLKRPSGGETVILTPATLVIACTSKLQTFNRPRDFFKWCNDIIIGVLNDYGTEGLHQKGISDISVGDKKILGSAMFKAPDRYFYHAVLNVSELPGTIAWYIRHPGREPDYRKGRTHAEFVTSMAIEGIVIDFQQIKKELFNNFQQHLNQLR